MPDRVSPTLALPPASRRYGEIGARSERPHWGMVIDQERCIGCWSCAVICKSENDVPLGGWWNRILTDGEDIDEPRMERGELRMEWIPLACQHCENAPCVKVCPVQATYYRDDGIVMQDPDRCIGCRYCMIACPYGVRTFNWGRPERATPYEHGMVAARPLGTVEKCTMCVHRIAEGQIPSCVWSCPAQARIFGDLNDPASSVAKLARRAHVLLEERGTRPSVAYLPPRHKHDL